ncbi:separase isoform X2 [Brachypodium distachyon]|uniref:separase isoform X2 n=1 Tax=Brachypodium distachyon TaxID=15368 RepID=UPI00071DC44A|nr:separase isoform X2 [Brachypodium distachyon]|eukprot:XP_014756517.1 separase isoform X2 [Brachypodium distachyon]
MEAAADDLLAALSSPSSQAGLHSRFAAYLQPFTPHLPSANPNPKPPPKRTTKQKPPPPPPDAAAVRPLAKRFLPFLCRALKLLSPLLRPNNPSAPGGAGWLDELLEIYGLILDCLASISTCLAGKPYSVLLQRGHFVCCLESLGHYARAEAEAAAILDALRCALSPPVTSKPRRGAASVALLPDPAIVGEAGADPEITTLVVELTACLANCASKSKVKEAAPYERVLSLVEQLKPWLRTLSEETRRKYLALLVNALSRCAIFLAAESPFFSSNLVCRFCVATLGECEKAQMIERLPAVARKICSSVDLSWKGSTHLLLDVLKTVVASVLCGKADLPKAVNEFLEFVDYFSRRFLSSNRDVHVGASVLLYREGGYFSEISSPTACILQLYATGLYFSTQQVESEEHSSISNFLMEEKNLRTLNNALGTLALLFNVTYGKFNALDSLGKYSSSLKQAGHSIQKHSYSQSHEHIYFVSYLGSLEFVCKILVQHADEVWKNFSEGETVHSSGNMKYVLTALHQFIDSSLVAYNCTNISEGEKERLQEQRVTLLRALVSAIKMSFVTNEAIEKSLSSISCVISSTWVMLEEVKFLIPSLGNIGVALHNIGHFEKAPKALELCCQTIWAHTQLSYCRLSERTEGQIIEDLPRDTLKDLITDAFARIAKMVDTLHRCGAKMIRDIIVKSLSELLAYGDTPDYHNSSFVLIKLWVKIACKDFKDDQRVDSARLLYHSLVGYPSPLPKKSVGLILEQELLAYGVMESHATVLCAQMQNMIIDILLNELYCSKGYYLERSRVLVRKARVLRASGVQKISSCIESLSEAISLLQGILLDSSRGNAIVIHELAITYCLHAHCAQEANLGGKVIFDNARSAVGLWSKMDTFHHSSPSMIFQPPSETLVPLICSLVDLLAIKGCFELQFDLCKLLVMIWKQENLPLEKLFSMLFTGGRLNHVCCHLPMDQQFISYVVQHLGVDCHKTLFWIDCFKGDHPSLSMFLQQLWPIDFFFSQSSEQSFRSQFGFSASVDEVDKVASSLVSEVTSSNRSNYLAGYLYHGLSERLLSRGQLLQAISYGREALQLRKKLLKKKFKFNLGKFVSGESQCSGGQGFVSLEAWGPTIAEIWPDSTRSSSTSDSFFTPWNVLRCYLESVLQVAVMYELIGNGAEAEVLLRTGKEISCFQGLPFFAVVFTSALGQLYRKRQLWDAAESEIKRARDFLVENDKFITCKLCKLTLETSIDVQAGDLFWNLFEKDFQKQSTCNLSSALGMYQSAMEKLNNTGLEFLAGSYDKNNTSSIFCRKDCIAETKRRACNHGKEPVAANDGVLPPCTPCFLLSRTPIDQKNKLVGLKSDKQNLRNVEAAPPLDVKVKRASRSSSRLAKEQNVAAHAKTRTTRSSKRTAHMKDENDLAELNCKNGISWNGQLSTGALVCGKVDCSVDVIDCSRDGICNIFGCWSCLFVNSLNSGCIENILQFRLDCIRRRHLVSILLKTARALAAHGGKHGAHEVHSIYWQCISLLYFRSPPQDCYRTYGPYLIGLMMDENTGDFLSFERAEILCNMSFFLLKGFHSEQSRDVCCSLSSVQMSDVVSWLLKAFVLSAESPLLLQEVCRLLACIFLLSTIDSTIQLPLYSKGSLSLNHWAAYFHQTSVGTYLNYQYLASLQALPRKKDCKGSIADFENETNVFPKFLRFSSADIEHLEKLVTEFFHELPDVPIVCISVLGGDFVNVLGETLLLPSLFPAWMLLSRFESTNKPTTMLLPVDPILEETLDGNSSIIELDYSTRASDKNWKCPWGYTIVDYVAPTFKKLLEDNFRSLSGANLSPKDERANTVRWWSDRMKLNDHLDEILENMEELWLGPWKCLLIGHQLADQHNEEAMENIITGLESEFKLEANPALIKGRVLWKR